MQVGNLTRPRVHRDVVGALVRRILSGALVPGEVLPNTAQLSADLGVSKTALREAIKVLGAKGMVEVRTRTGTRVRPRDSWNLLDPEVLSWCGPELDADLLRSLLQCRQLIEPGAAVLASAHATAAQLAAIEAAFIRMTTAADLNSRVEADLDFHVAVLRASGNLFLAQWATATASVLLAAFRLSTGTAQSHDAAFEVHRDVLEAIRLRNGPAAGRAMRRLLAVAARDLRLQDVDAPISA
jgi:DNA-binding FadR family transcriptional regulator